MQKWCKIKGYVGKEIIKKVKNSKRVLYLGSEVILCKLLYSSVSLSPCYSFSSFLVPYYIFTSKSVYFSLFCSPSLSSFFLFFYLFNLYYYYFLLLKDCCHWGMLSGSTGRDLTHNRWLNDEQIRVVMSCV